VIHGTGGSTGNEMVLVWMRLFDLRVVGSWFMAQTICGGGGGGIMVGGNGWWWWWLVVVVGGLVGLVGGDWWVCK
jgi:uncharacterized membrane protein YfcA